MRALVSKTYAPLDQIEITELPTPAAGPGQLLVRVQAAALNPLDVKMVTGVFREMFPVEHPFVNNQFGPQNMTLLRRSELCLPALLNPPVCNNGKVRTLKPPV